MRDAGFGKLVDRFIDDEAELLVEGHGPGLAVQVELWHATRFSIRDDCLHDHQSDIFAAPVLEYGDASHFSTVGETGGADGVAAFILGEEMCLLWVESVEFQFFADVLADDKYLATHHHQSIAVAIIVPVGVADGEGCRVNAFATAHLLIFGNFGSVILPLLLAISGGGGVLGAIGWKINKDATIWPFKSPAGNRYPDRRVRGVREAIEINGRYIVGGTRAPGQPLDRFSASPSPAFYFGNFTVFMILRRISRLFSAYIAANRLASAEIIHHNIRIFCGE